MSNVINMKALKTFYGTDGYIVAGQEFFTTSEALANSYYADKVAVFADGSQPETSDEDLKVQARERFESVGSEEGQTEFKTSQLERNVTSMAKPVNLKIAVSGVNPEDLNIEVVRDEEVQAETRTIEADQAQQQQAQYPAEKQQLQPNYANQAQNQNYNQQNQQPSQQQAQPQQPSAANQSEQSSQQAQSSQREQELEQREAELIRQLNELQQQQAELKQSSGQQSSPQQSSNQENTQQQSGQFEVRHVGGGWYDLPNGERVQGKENAEMRMREIESAYQHQQGQVSQQSQNEGGFTPNSEYVQQANTGAVRPEDGQSLNQAQTQTYGALSGGQPQGGLSAQNQDRSMQGTGHDSGSSVSQSNQAQGMTSQASGAQGNTTGGAAQSGNTQGGGATSSGGNNTGGAGQANNTGGGNSGGGNTGQGSGGNTGQ